MLILILGGIIHEWSRHTNNKIQLSPQYDPSFSTFKFVVIWFLLEQQTSYDHGD